MEKSEKHRVLVISNNPFSQSDANGRTLGELFLGIDPANIWQFFLNDKPIDMIDCHYVQIPDLKMVKSLFSMRPFRETDFQVRKDSYAMGSSKKSKRNPFTWILRNLLWSFFFLEKKKSLKKWISSTVAPKWVLLQTGDSPFMNKLAIEAAKWSNAKLIVFNTEDYCFKKWDYSPRRSVFSFLWPISHFVLMKSMKKLIKASSFNIYNSLPLLKKYESYFPSQKADVIYTTTHWVSTPYSPSKGPMRLTYFGNLSGKRSDALAAVAEIIRNEKLNILFDVYGFPESSEQGDYLRSLGVNLHSFVPYSSLKGVVDESDVLLHVESFDSFTKKDRIYGFSTKIADCLASGRCFLVFAPGDIAFCQYLQENKCAYVCTTSTELAASLYFLSTDVQTRFRYMKNAKETVLKNHAFSSNSAKFLSILEKTR